MGKLDAPRQAPLSILRSREGLPHDRGPGRTPPWLWAAWVRSGAPGDERECPKRANRSWRPLL